MGTLLTSIALSGMIALCLAIFEPGQKKLNSPGHRINFVRRPVQNEPVKVRRASLRITLQQCDRENLRTFMNIFIVQNPEDNIPQVLGKFLNKRPDGDYADLISHFIAENPSSEDAFLKLSTAFESYG